MKTVFRTLRESEYLVILLSIILMIFVVPLWDQFSLANVLVDISILLTLMGSVHAVSKEKGPFVFSLIVLSVWILAYLWHFISRETIVLMANNIIAIIFYSHISLVLLDRVVRYRTVTFDTIAGALAVYLLIGVIGAFIYSTIYLFDPAAIAVKPELLHTDSDQRRLDIFTYFSFVTLTTLGYGDITPVSTLARTQVYLEALMGQIYITVLIARLVSLQVADSSRTNKSAD